MVDQLPTCAASQLQPVAEAEMAAENVPGQRPGRLQANIISREEDGSVTWYTIKVRYDGTERDCRKRYSDFVRFNNYLRTRLPCHKDMLPELPSSGRVGLRHKLDLGTFNHRRQVGLEQFLETAVQIVGEQPVRRFLLNPTTSDNFSSQHLPDIARGSASKDKNGHLAAEASAKLAAASGGC